MQLAVSGRTVLDILCFTPSRYPLKLTTIPDSILADKRAGQKKRKEKEKKITRHSALHMMQGQKPQPIINLKKKYNILLM